AVDQEIQGETTRLRKSVADLLAISDELVARAMKFVDDAEHCGNTLIDHASALFARVPKSVRDHVSVDRALAQIRVMLDDISAKTRSAIQKNPTIGAISIALNSLVDIFDAAKSSIQQGIDDILQSAADELSLELRKATANLTQPAKT